MSYKQICQGRTSSAYEFKDFRTALLDYPEEPKTPTNDPIEVDEPDSPTATPTLALPPAAEYLALPPIPRKEIPPAAAAPAVPAEPAPKPKVSVVDLRSRRLEEIPDRASNTIQRVVNSRIRKSRPSNRPRMTKNPRSSPYHCRHCQVTCTGRVQWFEHLRSRKHQTWLNKDRFNCEICNVKATSAKDLDRHNSGRPHRDTASGKKKNQN